jgi:hypothetical protein
MDSNHVVIKLDEYLNQYSENINLKNDIKDLLSKLDDNDNNKIIIIYNRILVEILSFGLQGFSLGKFIKQLEKDDNCIIKIERLNNFSEIFNIDIKLKK